MYIWELPWHNSIKVGEITLPPKGIEDFVARSVRLLTFEHDDRVSFFGSCTLFKWKNEKFAVTTRHQLNTPRGFRFSDEALKSLRIEAMNDGLLANILVDSCIFETANPDQEYHDLVIFHVAPDVVQTTKEPFSFFPIFEIKNCYYMSSFCVGYPSAYNSIDYATNHLKSVRAIHGCRKDRDFLSNADYFERFIGKDASFDFDGFSGGAVFSLIKNAGGYEIGLDGIILRAGRGFVHTVSSNYLRSIIR